MEAPLLEKMVDESIISCSLNNVRLGEPGERDDTSFGAKYGEFALSLEAVLSRHPGIDEHDIGIEGTPSDRTISGRGARPSGCISRRILCNPRWLSPR